MGHAEIGFVPLLIVIALAFVVPILLSRVKAVFIPVVVGELVAGMIVGQSGFDLIQQGSVLEVLSTLGFAFLMFLSGLEIDLGGFLGGEEESDGSGPRRIFGNPLGMGLTALLLTLAGSVGVGFLLVTRGLVGDPWIMALILSTTSLGVVMPVLKEQGLTRGPYGQAIIVSSMIADFTTILLISFYALIYRQGLSLDLMLVLVLLAAFLVIYRVVISLRHHPPAERLFEQLSSATAQLGLRGSLALALLFIAMAEYLGIEYILGAFLAGVIISSLTGGGAVLQEKLDAFGYGFFIPIFFIMVGVNFDLPSLLNSRDALLLVPMLIVLAYAVKLVPMLIYRIRFSWRETLAAGVLVSSRLSLIVAAAAVGLELGVITDAVNSAIILIAVITCTASPILFSWLMPDQEERDRIIVVGSRASAELLANRLRKHEFETVLVSEDAVPKDTDLGFSEMLGDAQAGKAHTVVTMRRNDKDNLEICRAARRDHGVENIISWVQNPALNGDFREAGARVTNPAYSAVLSIESMVLSPGTFSLTADVDETREVREVRIRRRELHGRPLSKLDLPGEAIVLMIERDGGVIVPDQVTENELVLQRDDVVTLAGNAGEVDEAIQLLK